MYVYIHVGVCAPGTWVPGSKNTILWEYRVHFKGPPYCRPGLDPVSPHLIEFFDPVHLHISSFAFHSVLLILAIKMSSMSINKISESTAVRDQ